MAPSFRAFSHPGNYSLNLDAETPAGKKERPVGINGDWAMEQWEKNQRGENKEWEAKSAGRHAEAFSSANGQYK